MNHFYGKTTIVSKKSTGVQHIGLGKKLVKRAEWISLYNGYSNLCITSGIGVREYYRKKLGYHLEGMYMKKNILIPFLFRVSLIFLLISIFIIIWYNYIV